MRKQWLHYCFPNRFPLYVLQRTHLVPELIPDNESYLQFNNIDEKESTEKYLSFLHILLKNHGMPSNPVSSKLEKHRPQFHAFNEKGSFIGNHKGVNETFQPQNFDCYVEQL